MSPALLIASAAMSAATITPRVEFARADGPLVVRVAGLEGVTKLVLLAADGKEISRAPATAGDLDLGQAFPMIRDATSAVRVQVVSNGSPEGAPVVVVPLRGRDTIRTASDLRADGKTRYTRVIGWGDRLLNPANESDAKLKEDWAKSDPQPLSGFRLMADEDVVFDTTVGRIRFAMCPDQAPNTARNFVELARKGFYDGTIVHRIVPADRNGHPFVIQGGDPTGSGDGGPGYDLPLEPSQLPHDFGVVSMARNDWPDSAGSQWFVCLSREGTARLDGQYCAFGYAVEGADAIIRIAAGEVADPATGKPRAPESIVRAYTLPAPAWIPGKGRPDARVTRPETTAERKTSDR